MFWHGRGAVVICEGKDIVGVEIIYPTNVNFDVFRFQQRVFAVDGRNYWLGASRNGEFGFFSFLGTSQNRCG
jgi:hypothetical protein